MIRNLATGVDVFTSNVFLVDGERTVVVDPGANFDAVEAISEWTDSLDAVVLTHTHPDHVGNAASVASAFDVDVWGFDAFHPAVDHEIADGDEIQLGDDTYGVIHTPGHKDDHVCLYAVDPGILFVGDLVFAGGGFGRTDLEEGDRPTLLESIGRLLDTVEADFEVMHCGHGPSVDRDPYGDIETAYRMAEIR